MKDYDELAAEKVREAKSQLDLLPKTLGDDFVRRANLRVVEAQKKRVESDSPIQHPFWPEPIRAIPSELLRSALFGCMRRGGFVDGQKLAAWGKTTLTYTGKRLSQFDESLWLQLVHLCRGQSVSPGHNIHISARALLRELGIKGGGGSGIRRLNKSLDRLMSAVVTLSRGDIMLKLASPVRRAAIDKGTGRFAVELNPDWSSLLNEQATYLDWDTRKSLPTGIATWMHRYILSHRATPRSPHRVGVEKLHALSGMQSVPKEFKRHLKAAMEKLRSRNVVMSWRFTQNNALEFVRPKKASKKLPPR